MEVWGARGEAAQDGPLDLADISELAVDQGLAEIASGFAVVARLAVPCEAANRRSGAESGIPPGLAGEWGGEPRGAGYVVAPGSVEALRFVRKPG
jgi:hypothetical protein